MCCTGCSIRVRDENVKSAAELRRKAAISLGVAVIALVFLLETSIAHRSSPSPRSPLVWGLLGVMAVGGVAGWAWWRGQARRADD